MLKRILPDSVLSVLRRLQPLYKLRRQLDTTNELLRAIAATQRFDSLDAEKIVEFDYEGRSISFHVPRGCYDLIQQHQLIFEDFYESAILHDIRRRHLDAGSVVVDVGANVGNHAVYFAKVAGVRSVTCFEPQSFEFRTLTRNIAVNGLDNVRAINVGLGDKEGRADFAHGEATSTAHGNRGSVGLLASSSGPVVVRTLDSFNVNECSFMKIDVEGHTYEVLAGARDTIRRLRPLILAEIFPSEYRRCKRLLVDELGYGFARDYGDHNYLFEPTINR